MNVPSNKDTKKQILSLFDDLPPHVVQTEHFYIDYQNQRVVRNVRTRDNKEIKTSLPLLIAPSEPEDPCSAFDYSWLRLKHWPSQSDESLSRGTIYIADLFSGCGGLSLGAKEACRALSFEAKHIVAADMDLDTLKTYAVNFNPEIDLKTVTKLRDDPPLINAPIDQIINGDIGSVATTEERKLIEQLDKVDLLVGGPPCQGHSNLNNHTRREDEKNLLILKMARFAELTDAEHIIIENVPTVVNDRTRSLHQTHKSLVQLGYNVSQIDSLHAADFGVAQTRKRFFLVASKTRDVRSIRDQIYSHTVGLHRSFQWACEDLAELQSTDVFDNPPEISPVNQNRIEYLFRNDVYELDNTERPDCHKNGHTYPSVYGRLWQDKPSPTITRGFGGMGQGRYVHPTKKRLITPHEAARLQFFPDFFRFKTKHRTHLQNMIGNAVPPKLAYLIALNLLR
jgi:DNA (cytosine-5)-methyltransferase 1